MGRKKKYDRETLIKKAMEIFYAHGFAETSTQMLVDGLGVNRFSLYAEFENKQTLFDAVLDYYNAEILDLAFGPLEKPSAGVNEIFNLFETFRTDSDGQTSGLGCLLCNTAVEFGPNDPSGAGFVQRYFKRLSSAFLNALSNAQRDGALDEAVVIQDEADFLTASTLGLFVMMRASAPSTLKENAINTSIRHLNRLRS